MQIGEAFVTIRPDTDGFAQETQAGVVGATKAAAGALAAAVGTQQVVQFFQGAVTEASNLNEALSLTSQTFGDSANVVLAFGEESATSIGLASSEALQFANNIGGLFVGLGTSREEAARLSTEVLTLAADLASAKNLAGGTGEALQILQSGLVGEVEPLRRVGVAFNAAAVEARALADTGKSSAAALTEGEKAAARYALILEQLGTQGVVGDFARTSGGLANQQRILNAEWQEAQAEIGAQLLPAVIDLVDVMREGIDVFGDYGDSAAGSADGIGALADGLGVLSDVVGGLDGFFEAITGGSTDFFGLLVDAIPGVGQISSVIGKATDLFGDYEKEAVNAGAAGKEVGGGAEEAAAGLDSVADAADAARTELDELFGARQSVAEGAIRIRDNARDLQAALEELGQGGYQAGTESGDAFLSSLQDQGTAIRDYLLSLAETNASAGELAFAQDLLIGGLRRTAEAAGLPEAAIRTLIEVFAQVPNDVTTEVRERGARVVTERLNAMNTKARDIPRQVTVNTDLQGEEAVISGLQAIYQEALRAANAVGQTGGSLAGGGSYGNQPPRGRTRPSPLNESGGRSVPESGGRSAPESVGGRTVVVNVNAGTVVGDPRALARELAPEVAREIDVMDRSL